MVLVCVQNASWNAEHVPIKPVKNSNLVLSAICHLRNLLTLDSIIPLSPPWREMARVSGAWKETVTLCLLCLFTGLLILSLASTTSSSSLSTSRGGGHFGQGPKTINCVPLKCSPNLVVKIMAKNPLWTKKSFQKILFYELEWNCCYYCIQTKNTRWKFHTDWIFTK